MNTRVKCRSFSWPVTKEFLICNGLRLPFRSRESPVKPAGVGYPPRWPWSMKHLPGEFFVPSSISITVCRDGSECSVDARDFQTDLISSASNSDLLLCDPEQESSKVLNNITVVLGSCSSASCTACPTARDHSISKCMTQKGLRKQQMLLPRPSKLDPQIRSNPC